MTDPNFVILYVKDPSASAAFYADVLGRTPVEASPTFVMFALSSGVMLGLWLRDNVAPAATDSPGGAELAIRWEMPTPCGPPMRIGAAASLRSPSRRPPWISASPSWPSILTATASASLPRQGGAAAAHSAARPGRLLLADIGISRQR